MSRRIRDIRPLALIAGSGALGVLGTLAVLSMNRDAHAPAAPDLEAVVREAHGEDAEARKGVTPHRMLRISSIGRTRIRGSARISVDADPTIHVLVDPDPTVYVTVDPDPILYVDGVRVDRTVTNSESTTPGNMYWAVAGIDPDDVHRIEVLKGPAARRMYGNEGANGVIQVFTKSGAGSDSP